MKTPVRAPLGVRTDSLRGPGSILAYIVQQGAVQMFEMFFHDL